MRLDSRVVARRSHSRASALRLDAVASADAHETPAGDDDQQPRMGALLFDESESDAAADRLLADAPPRPEQKSRPLKSGLESGLNPSRKPSTETGQLQIATISSCTVSTRRLGL
jgi:hypothetical protein